MISLALWPGYFVAHDSGSRPNRKPGILPAYYPRLIFMSSLYYYPKDDTLMTFEDMPNNTKWLKGALITRRHQQKYVAGRFLFYLFILRYVISVDFKSKYFMLWAPWSQDSRCTKYRPSLTDFFGLAVCSPNALWHSQQSLLIIFKYLTNVTGYKTLFLNGYSLAII